MDLPIHIVLLFFVKAVLTYKSDLFTEELLVKPLYSGQLYAHFQFTTKWNSDFSSEDCMYI